MTHLELAGEAVLLHHDRALFWPAQGALMVADVHLGKDSVFRQSGIAVPSGDTLADLSRLDDLIAAFNARALWVLGDLVHGSAPADTPWLADVRAWRERHARVDMHLIAGNHDRHFDTASLGFSVLPGEQRRGPFVLRHDPEASAEGYVLAGHVHPAVTMRDGWRRHRLPAFVFGARVGLLPAFGSFTGLADVRTEPGDRVYAATPGGLLEVTGRRRP
jgi:uncharacterized protein